MAIEEIVQQSNHADHVVLLDLRVSGEAQLSIKGQHHTMHYQEEPSPPYVNDEIGDGPDNPLAEQGKEFSTLRDARIYIEAVVLAYYAIRRARAILCDLPKEAALQKRYGQLERVVGRLQGYREILHDNPRLHPVLEILTMEIPQIPSYVNRAFDKLDNGEE